MYKSVKKIQRKREFQDSSKRQSEDETSTEAEQFEWLVLLIPRNKSFIQSIFSRKMSLTRNSEEETSCYSREVFDDVKKDICTS